MYATIPKQQHPTQAVGSAPSSSKHNTHKFKYTSNGGEVMYVSPNAFSRPPNDDASDVESLGCLRASPTSPSLRSGTGRCCIIFKLDVQFPREAGGKMMAWQVEFANLRSSNQSDPGFFWWKNGGRRGGGNKKEKLCFAWGKLSTAEPANRYASSHLRMQTAYFLYLIIIIHKT